MSLQQQQQQVLATSPVAPPSLLTQVGMAGSAAVITVTFIHPIDVVKVRINEEHTQKEGKAERCDGIYCWIMILYLFN